MRKQVCALLLVSVSGCTGGEEASLALPGRVSGAVYTEIGEERFALPGAEVHFERAPLDVESLSADNDGRFVAFLTKNQRTAVRVCAIAPGFAEACEEAEILPEEGTLVELALNSTDGLLYGTALNADGRPCWYDNPSFETAFETTVSVGGGATVRADREGRFVVGGVVAGAYSLQAVCAGVTASRMVTVDQGADVSGPVALELNNHGPVIHSLVATDESGGITRHPRPGQSVTVTVEASDPDGDPLEVRWFVNEQLQPERQSSVDWTLPGDGGNNTLAVQVSDGRGGVATHDLWLSTGEAGARFSGAVVDETEQPLEGVHVLVNGTEVSSDAAGRFRVIAPETSRYTVTAYATGRAIVSRVLDSEVSGLTLKMPAARTHTINPNQPTEVLDAAVGVRLQLDEEWVVDEHGAIVTEPYTLSLHQYAQIADDPEPGDGAALTVDSAEAAIDLAGVLSILFTDQDGNRLYLQPGVQASVGFSPPVPMEPDPCDEPPPSPPAVAQYSDSQGLWVVSTATLSPGSGGRTWDTEISVAGPVAVGSIFDYTCLSVQADRGSIAVPLTVSVAEYTGCHEPSGSPIYEHVRDVVIPNYDAHVISGLKANGFYQLTVVPTGVNGTLYYSGRPLFQRIQAPPTNASVGAYPFTACQSRPEILQRYASTVSTKQAKFRSTNGQAYYESIDAYTTRPNFGAWLNANGFGTDDGVTARFYNAAELGIGREVTCRKDGKRIACYIVKYGAPGGPVAETLDDVVHRTNPSDIVAIDSNSDASRIRFYVYSPTGELKTSTKFVPGQEWQVPGACYGCHWVTEYPGTGVLVPVDPNTHIYADELPRESQAENIRRINAMVASMTKVTTQTTRDYIKLLYPQGVGNLGSPVADAVFPDWQTSATTEQAYRWTMRSHCQVCHIGVRDWASRPNELYQASAACSQFMPGSWVSHRNLWQGLSKVAILIDATDSQVNCKDPFQPEVNELPPP